MGALSSFPPLSPERSFKTEKEITKKKRVPNALIVHIFSFVPMQNLSQCSRVCSFWKFCSFDRTALKIIVFRSKNIPVNTRQEKIKAAWKYREISSKCDLNDPFQTAAAIAACEEGAKFNTHNAAYGLKELCNQACKKKNFSAAAKCQQLAHKYYADAGNQALAILIKAKIEEPDFTKNAEHLIRLSQNLLLIGNEGGLHALSAIAKKCKELRFFDKVNSIAQIMQIAEKRIQRDDLKQKIHNQIRQL